MGLLLLRGTVGLSSILAGEAWLTGSADLGWSRLVGLMLLISGTLLAAGFLTPIACAMTLAGVGLLLAGVMGTAAGFLDSWLAEVFLIVMTIAIVLLGPGAVSIDSYLFGRREIRIPPSPNSSRD